MVNFLFVYMGEVFFRLTLESNSTAKLIKTLFNSPHIDPRTGSSRYPAALFESLIFLSAWLRKIFSFLLPRQKK